MQEAIQPKYSEIKVTCSCGDSFTTRSTMSERENAISIDVCSKCHPFYTGKQKIVDTSGRVDRFKQRYAKKPAVQPKADDKK